MKNLIFFIFFSTVLFDHREISILDISVDKNHLPWSYWFLLWPLQISHWKMTCLEAKPHLLLGLLPVYPWGTPQMSFSKVLFFDIEEAASHLRNHLSLYKHDRQVSSSLLSPNPHSSFSLYFFPLSPWHELSCKLYSSWPMKFLEASWILFRQKLGKLHVLIQNFLTELSGTPAKELSR